MSGLGGLSPAGAVTIGIFVGLISTSIQSIGLTLQRKSHLLEDSKEDETVRRPPYRRRRWQIGMAMFVLSNIVGSTVQITTLPLPVLSTLQASGLVFNTICATILLGEPFTKWSLFGTGLVAGGAILIALFGAVPEPSHNLDQLLHLLGRRQFILWMIGTFLIMFLVLCTAYSLGRFYSEHSPRVRFWRGMCFGLLSGILSAHSLLVAKSAVELIVRTIASSSNQFNRWQSWIILLLLVFFALTQLYYLHRGLKLCSTSVLYPFVFCIYNIIAILDGLIYFKQTSRLPALHAGLITLGTVILLSGVLALSWRLEDDGTTPPADAHTLLTPGMGIVEDTTTESESEGEIFSTTFPDLESGDDENTLLMSHERTPLLKTKTAPDTETLRGSIRFTKPREHRNSSVYKWNHFQGNRRRRNSTATDIEHIWSELQDENDEGGAVAAKHRRASTRTAPHYRADSPTDADTSRSPSPSRLSSPFSPRRTRFQDDPISPNLDPLSQDHEPSSRHHLRAHTLTGTGIDVHVGAGIGAHSTATGNHIGGGLNPNASAYARHVREQRRRRRRWSSRYRSASLPGPTHTRSMHRVQSLGAVNTEAGQSNGSTGDVAADGQRGVSGWVRWLLGRSARRRDDNDNDNDEEERSQGREGVLPPPRPQPDQTHHQAQQQRPAATAIHDDEQTQRLLIRSSLERGGGEETSPHSRPAQGPQE